MGLPFSQQPGPVAAPPTGVVAPPVPAGPIPVVVVAVDEGDRPPGLNALPDDIAGDVAVVGCPPLTRSSGASTRSFVLVPGRSHLDPGGAHFVGGK